MSVTPHILDPAYNPHTNGALDNIIFMYGFSMQGWFLTMYRRSDATPRISNDPTTPHSEPGFSYMCRVLR